MRWFLSAVVVPLLLFPTIAYADQFASQKEALHIIGETATSICENIEQSGSTTKEAISGKIGIQLPVITRKLIDLGVEGAGKLESDECRGVIREQLADLIKHATDCRKSVFDKLIVVLLPPPPKAQMLTTRGPVSFELESCDPALGAIQCTLVVSVSRPGNLILIGNMPRDGLESQLIPDNSHVPYPASVNLDTPYPQHFAMSKIQIGMPRRVYVTVQDLPTDADAGPTDIGNHI